MSAKKIFIVDDDIDYINGTKVVLESVGYEVGYITSPKEAVENIERFGPDLIIMDVMMEKMSDGFDLSREVKNDDRFKDIPIMMVTAVGDETGFHFSAEAGDRAWLPVDDFIEKPISPDELITKVAGLLGNR